MEKSDSQIAALATQGQGTTGQFVVFQLAGTELAIPVDQVQEILVFTRVTKVPKVPDFIEGIIDVRGRIIPVLNLGKRFAMPEHLLDSETRIIVAEVAEQTIGLVVDAVSEVLRVPLSTIEPAPALIAGVSPEFLTGVARLQTRILVILNLERILNPSELTELKATTRSGTASEPVSAPPATAPTTV